VWEAACRQAYARWDLRITGFVIDGNAPPMTDEVKRAYARFSTWGVVAQKIPPQSLVDGVPFLRMSADLSDPDQGAKAIAAATPAPEPGSAAPAAPHFAIFRTILWTPSAHKRMFDTLRTQRPDIQVVDPHVLFLLMKHTLQNAAP
jgi:hypothetical protein